MNWCHL